MTSWDQKVFAATLQPYFFTLGIASFLSKYGASGQLPDISLWMWAGIAALTIVGSWLDVTLQKIVSPKLARLVVIVICFVGSIAAIVDGALELQL